MKAVVLESAGARPVLRDAEIPAPRPGPGEALVRVEACGFSHHDALIMEGTLRRGVTLPRVLGHEVAGTVVGVGDGVAKEMVGTAVVVMPGELGHRRDGGLAELLTAPADSLVALAGAPTAGSALLASPMGVALKALDACGLSVGATLVATGVSGGIGSHAAQIAYTAGAAVLGVTGSPSKARTLEAQPWLASVLLDSDPWEEVVRAMTGDAGADAALDTVGSSLSRLVASLRRGGRLVLAGQVSADEARLAPAEVIFRELTIVGSLGAERQHVERIMQLVAGGQVAPVVDEELPLSAESVMRAYERVKGREVVGRIVIGG